MSAKILVVEDDLNMLQLIVETLEDEDYQVLGAASSVEALALATKNEFDLVVTDVRMAGVNGIDGFVLLKRKLPNLRCIVITGWADDEAAASAVKIQVDDFISKPFALDLLLDSVDRIANSSQLALYYRNIIQKVPKLFSGAFRFLKKDEKAELDYTRRRTFQGLFVGIRSKLVVRDSANGVFVQLSRLDTEYKQWLAKRDEKLAQKLIPAYSRLFDFLTSLAEKQVRMTEPERLPIREFNTLYDAIQECSISPEEFQLAPTLRTASPAELGSSTELLKLREKMWGPFSTT